MANKSFKKTKKKAKKSGIKGRRSFYLASTSSPVHKILSLQQTIGNRTVQRLFNFGYIQTKLKIGKPNDIYEQEADRVAEQVMQMPENSVISGQQPAIRKKNESVQAKPT